MKVLGTSSQGNPIVEIEERDLDVVRDAATVLNAMITARGLCAAVPVGPSQAAPRAVVKPDTMRAFRVKPIAAPTNDADQKPNAKCATCGKPFRRRTSEKVCLACRVAGAPKASGAKVTVIPPKPVTQRQALSSSDPLDTVNRMANQTRREDAGE